MKRLVTISLLTILLGFYIVNLLNMSEKEVFTPLPDGAPINQTIDRRSYEELQNVEAMVERFNLDFLRSLYNVTPSTVEDSVNRINELTYGFDDSLRISIPVTYRRFITYRRENYEIAKEFYLNDGSTYYGVSETVRVSYTENGEAREDILHINLGYISALKSFKVINMEINP